jgi:thioredoxin reductase
VSRGVEEVDVAIVGGGPAGLSAALELRRRGIGRVLVLEREAEAGGVPRLCAHQGFGLRDRRRLQSGPRYASSLVEAARRAGISLRTSTTVTSLAPGCLELSSPSGLGQLGASAVLLATGARERPRAARLIPGDRPAGVLTTGQLQQLVAAGLPVGRRALVVGAELVSYSAVLSLRHGGVEVVGMLSEHPVHQAPRGTAAAVRLGFGISLRCSSRLVEIRGRSRVSELIIEHLASGRRESVACDTVVLTGDWIPDHELARRAGIGLDQGTLGPASDADGRTDVDGVFAAGNLVHPVETADVVARRARRVAAGIAASLAGQATPARVGLEAGEGVGWVWPNLVELGAPPRRLSLRVARPGRAVLEVRDGGRLVAERSLGRALPNRHLSVPGSILAAATEGPIGVELR